MSDVADLEKFVKRYKELKTEIAKVIVGQDEVVKLVVTCILMNSRLESFCSDKNEE